MNRGRHKKKCNFERNFSILMSRINDNPKYCPKVSAYNYNNILIDIWYPNLGGIIEITMRTWFKNLKNYNYSKLIIDDLEFLL